jgi:predicted permease
MFHIADLKYALRLLKKSPGFTAMTILVLAGGLAISIYTWALLNTMLFKDLPVADGGTVVRILGTNDGFRIPIGAWELSSIREDAQSLSEIGVYNDAAVLLSTPESSRSINATFAEWNIFEFTRVRPMLGRGFVSADNIDGAEPVVVLGHTIWQSVFSGDPDIIDKVITINRKPTRVVGVMPQGFAFPIGAGIWMPMPNREMNPTAYVDYGLNAYGRLAPGHSADDVMAELAARLLLFQQQNPRVNAEENDYDGVAVSSFQLAQTGDEGGFVFTVLNLVSMFILLLACVNVGNMLLARTNERIREIAVRVALGAPRWRLMLQMMLESVIICLVGGVFAVLLAGWMLSATNSFMGSTFEGDLPFWWSWGLDGGTVAIAAVFVLLAIFLVSALPTWSATCVNANALLRDGTRGARGRTSGRISRALVTVQIVLISVVTVIGSAMAIVAYRAANIDFGMDTRNLMTMRVTLDTRIYDTPEKQLLYWERLLSEVRRSSEIEAAMVSGDMGTTRFAIDDAEYLTLADYPEATQVIASETPVPIGTQLIEGRNFDVRDGVDGLKSVIISQYMAETFWPGASALGKRIRIMDEAGKAQDQRVVVGVVSNVRRGENLLRTDKTTFAALYLPLPQSITSASSLLLRHRGNENAARTAMYEAVENIDAYVVPGAITSYSQVQNKLTLMATTMTDLFIRCGLFAVLLAMTGIYGLSSNGVVQRTHEIGLRRAIGATDGNIIGLFLKQGSRQLTVGFVISALISVGVLYLISTFAGVGVLTLVGVGLLVALLVSGLVLLAIYISTRQVVRHEPTVALRYE